MILLGGWEAAIRSWTSGEYEGEGALRVPAWPTRFTILIGSALACFNYLLMGVSRHLPAESPAFHRTERLRRDADT